MLKRRAKKGEPLAFIEMAKLYEGEDCLLWPFAVNSHGYASFSNRNAHSLVCPGEKTSEKYQAAHLCGNKLCMNPNHLEWSSQFENEIDKRIQGKRVGRPKTGPNIIHLSEFLARKDSR